MKRLFETFWKYELDPEATTDDIMIPSKIYQCYEDFCDQEGYDTMKGILFYKKMSNDKRRFTGKRNKKRYYTNMKLLSYDEDGNSRDVLFENDQ